jgi:hypothetical protein
MGSRSSDRYNQLVSYSRLIGGLLTDASIDQARSRARRPAWFARAPDVELDCRTEGTDGVAAIRTVMKEAERLQPGQILAIRIGFEPTFLCRVLAGKGFNHWPEPSEGGEWRIYFLRKLGERSRP